MMITTMCPVPVCDSSPGALPDKGTRLRMLKNRPQDVPIQPLGRRSAVVVRVQPFTQFLAGLEKRDPLFLDKHRFAGSGIAPGP